jgi:hypothetical protein
MDSKHAGTQTTRTLTPAAATPAAFVLSIAMFFWFSFTYYLLPALLVGFEVPMR